MDTGLIRGFQEAGCDVRTFDYRSSAFVPAFLRRAIPRALHRISPRRIPAVERLDATLSNRRCEDTIRRFHPELVVALQAERLSAETVLTLRRHGAMTVNWLGDDPWRAVPLSVVPAYDVWAVFDQTYRPWLMERGARRVEHLPVGCDPLLARAGPLAPEVKQRWQSSICFVGSHIPRREEFLAVLTDLGLSIWGPGWDRAANPAVRQRVREARMLARHEWLSAFVAADVVVNIHAQGQEGLNLRVWEALAAKVCLVCDEKADLDRLLPGLVVTFRTPEQLRQQCQRLLADPTTRQQAAQQAQEYVLAHHTFAHRARTLLGWAEEFRR